FYFQAEDGIRDFHVTGVQTCALPILVVEAIRPHTELPLDVHLMIEEPDRYIPAFAKSGADWITIHQEVCPHLHRSVSLIKEQGKIGRASCRARVEVP